MYIYIYVYSTYINIYIYIYILYLQRAKSGNMFLLNIVTLPVDSSGRKISSPQEDFIVGSEPFE